MATVQEQVAAAMADAEYPERIACPECRAAFLRGDIPFPRVGDFCEECEGVTVYTFDCAECDLTCATMDDSLTICDECEAKARRRQRAEDNGRDQYEAASRERYLGIR